MNKWLISLMVAGSAALSTGTNAEIVNDGQVLYNNEYGDAIVALTQTQGMDLGEIDTLLQTGTQDNNLEEFSIATNDQLLSYVSKVLGYVDFDGYADSEWVDYYFSRGANSFEDGEITGWEYDDLVWRWESSIHNDDHLADMIDETQNYTSYGVSKDSNGNFYRTGIHYQTNEFSTGIPTYTFDLFTPINVADLGSNLYSVMLYNDTTYIVGQLGGGSSGGGGLDPNYGENTGDYATEDAGLVDVPAPLNVAAMLMGLTLLSAQRRRS